MDPAATEPPSPPAKAARAPRKPKAPAVKSAKGASDGDTGSAPAEVRVFGIRHHGPGSARSLLAALQSWRPDCVLVEGPPDADALLPWAGHGDIAPPVAILSYDPDRPRHAAFHPFAVFSPEWQAITWAVATKTPVRFMDLPQAHQLGREPDDLEARAEADRAAATETPAADPALSPAETASPATPPAPAVAANAPATVAAAPAPPPAAPAADVPDGANDGDGPDEPCGEADGSAPDDGDGDIRADPLGHLARVAGYSDGERWWEHMVEHRRDGEDLFGGILDAMTALREAAEARAAARKAAAAVAVKVAAPRAPTAGPAAGPGRAPAGRAPGGNVPAGRGTPGNKTPGKTPAGRGGGADGHGGQDDEDDDGKDAGHAPDGAGAALAVARFMERMREAEELREARREAWMRRTIRAEQAAGRRRIAVVCGAWHAPVLAKFPADAESDERLLAGLPPAGKVATTWIPWTHGRLASESGYGAGVESPGWYHHLWTAPDRPAVRWMTRVARLLRDKDIDVSAAHVIEGVRLSETLAALRGRPLPGLPEFNEAVQSVFCFGGDLPMRLVRDGLIVGEMLGRVPDDVPMVPLAADLAREVKRLKMKQAASAETLELDLRKPADLDRSRLLHRLRVLGIAWGDITAARGKGTFKEAWRTAWKPEFAVELIEAGIHGNTVADAAAGKVRRVAEETRELAVLTRLVDDALLADLPEAIDRLMRRLQDEAAVAADLRGMMAALPPLANVTRYGNVRRTDAAVVGTVVDGLVARICIGLPAACASLDDDAASAMVKAIGEVHGAVGLLADEGHRAAWTGALTALADRDGLHGLVGGRAVRYLLDGGTLTAGQVADRMSLALSRGQGPATAAAWLEGFLTGSGLVLLHDDALWGLLDAWLSGLSAEAFQEAVPLLRRTFATFEAPERRQMGAKALRGPARPPVVASGIGASSESPAGSPGAGADAGDDFDHATAARAVATVGRLLGV